MSESNGDGTVRAATYRRVSTDEQAEHGYSLGGQRRDLLGHVEREGWRLVEEIEDDGYSGGDPFRPGLRRVMELAEQGAVDVVVAAKRDRLFRSRFYRLAFERDLAEFGVRLMALNDTGHRIGDGVLDDFAEWEREEIASRLHGGIRNMLVRGEVKAGPKPPYGYRLNGKALEVFEPEMEMVRTMFDRAAGGESMEAIRRHLEGEGIPSPAKSKKGWSKTTIRNILGNDLYAPHTAEAVTALVMEDVAAKLDPEAVYGLWVWNRRKTTKRKEWDEDKNEYVDRYKSEIRPRGEWLNVPVPASGVAAEVVVAARESMTGKGWQTKTGEQSVTQRFWELRGVVRCADCGSSLSPHMTGKQHGYYACRSRYNNVRSGCGNHRYYPADDLERAVLATMRTFLDKREHFLEQFEAHAEQERRRLRSLATAGSAESWHEELRRLDTRRNGFLAQEADGIIERGELRELLSTVEPERDRLREGLEAAMSYEKDAEELEAHLSRTREMIEGASVEWLNSRAKGTDRAEMYRRLRLRVEIDADDNMMLRGAFGDTLRSSLDKHSFENVMITGASLFKTRPTSRKTSTGRVK